MHVGSYHLSFVTISFVCFVKMFKYCVKYSTQKSLDRTDDSEWAGNMHVCVKKSMSLLIIWRGNRSIWNISVSCVGSSPLLYHRFSSFWEKLAEVAIFNVVSKFRDFLITIRNSRYVLMLFLCFWSCSQTTQGRSRLRVNLAWRWRENFSISLNFHILH